MKDIKGFEGIYAVTEDGRIWSYPKKGSGGHNGKWLKPNNTRRGYFFVFLHKENYNKSHLIHRIVATAFLSHPRTSAKQVNHKNGIKTDNRVANLEWTTALENMRHAFATGLIGRGGEKNSSAKLTSKDIPIIRAKHSAGISINAIAQEFDVVHETIRMILVKKTWKHVI